MAAHLRTFQFRGYTHIWLEMSRLGGLGQGRRCGHRGRSEARFPSRSPPLPLTSTKGGRRGPQLRVPGDMQMWTAGSGCFLEFHGSCHNRPYFSVHFPLDSLKACEPHQKMFPHKKKYSDGMPALPLSTAPHQNTTTQQQQQAFNCCVLHAHRETDSYLLA